MTKDCVLMQHHSNITGANFMITRTKLYVSVVALPINNNIKFLENIKQGFKRTLSCNKYRSGIRTQPKNNNLDYLVDPTFRNINRLFVLSFKNGNNDPTRHFFDKFNIPLVGIKDFNALVGHKSFFDQPLKKKQEAYEKLIKMSKNDNNTTGNLSNYLSHQNYYNFIGIYLSRQTNKSIP